MICAIYPGSFDPVTNGHVDIIDRASKVFPKVIVTVMENPRKVPLFTLQERENMLKKVVQCRYSNVEVDRYQGLLVDYVRSKHAKILIKGLRAISDFEFEFQMALLNRNLDENVETMFMMTNNKYSYLSSSVVKEVGAFGGDISGFVPAEVYEQVKTGISAVKF